MGKLVRDDDAMQMLKTAIRSLPMDVETIVHRVTELSLDAIRTGEKEPEYSPQRIKLDIERVCRKKEAVMDSYFSGQIPKEDMQAMNRRYDSQIEALRQRQNEATLCPGGNQDTKVLRTAIQGDVSAILSGELESEVFCKTMLESLTVFQDRHMELRLRHLPQVFQFIG